MSQRTLSATLPQRSDVDVSCPSCGGISHHLQESSERVSVDYFLCAACSEVWNRAKRYPGTLTVV